MKARAESVEATRARVIEAARAAILEAVKGFRRLKGHKDMPKLVAALRARDQRLDIAVSVENVA